MHRKIAGMNAEQENAFITKHAHAENMNCVRCKMSFYCLTI